MKAPKLAMINQSFFAKIRGRFSARAYRSRLASDKRSVRGQTTIEYVLLLALAALIFMKVKQRIVPTMDSMLNKIDGEINQDLAP